MHCSLVSSDQVLRCEKDLYVIGSHLWSRDVSTIPFPNLNDNARLALCDCIANNCAIETVRKCAKSIGNIQCSNTSRIYNHHG